MYCKHFSTPLNLEHGNFYFVLCVLYSSWWSHMLIVTFKLSIYKAKVAGVGCMPRARHCAKHFTQIVWSDPSLHPDLCHSLLTGAPAFSLSALQLPFHIETWIIIQECKWDHIAPLLKPSSSFLLILTKSQTPKPRSGLCPRIPSQSHWPISLVLKYDKSVSTTGPLQCCLGPLPWDMWTIGFLFIQVPVHIEFKWGESHNIYTCRQSTKSSRE